LLLRNISAARWVLGWQTSACSGEVDPVRRQEHAPKMNLRRFPSMWDHRVIPGSPSDPTWTENAVGAPAIKLYMSGSAFGAAYP
jgi:hypothetical protein